MRGSYLLCVIEGQRVMAVFGVPEVGAQIRRYRYAAQLIVSLETQADAPCGVSLAVEPQMGNAVMLVLQVNALINNLYLRLCNPAL